MGYRLGDLLRLFGQMKIATVILVIALLLASYIDGVRRSRLIAKRRFADRRPISFYEFYSSFYGKSGLDRELLREILEHVGNELELPVEMLRPTDRFSVELAPLKGWEWGSGHAILESEIRGLARKKGRAIDMARITTLDDYLRLMSSIMGHD